MHNDNNDNNNDKNDMNKNEHMTDARAYNVSFQIKGVERNGCEQY